MNIYRSEEFDPDEFIRRRLAVLPDVSDIIEGIKRGGDGAVKQYCMLYDGCAPLKFRASETDLKNARSYLPDDVAVHLDRAASHLRIFSEKQYGFYKDFDCEIEPGVTAGQRVAPLDAVGVYVPGGRFPLLSSLIMAIIPAQTAGVRRIAVCSPPTREGLPHRFILAAAARLGIREVYAVGGAQAVAAMAFGTESIPRVDKIVGPGNRFVAAAKKAVYGDVGVDFIAGPTEVLIIADDSARPRFVAMDLIAQAEHDPDAASILISDSREIIEGVSREVMRLVDEESFLEAARPSLKKNGTAVLVSSLDEAVAISDRIAPEHCIIHAEHPELTASKAKNYGSLFIGPWASEVLGDYCSGINHILPTNGAARYTGGIHVGSFLKTRTVLSVTEEGIGRIGPTAEALANMEGLRGHRNAVRVRLSDIASRSAP